MDVGDNQPCTELAVGTGLGGASAIMSCRFGGFEYTDMRWGHSREFPKLHRNWGGMTVAHTRET